MPDYLYKYRSLGGAGRLYAERLLIHNEVYFASPSTFNVPSTPEPGFRLAARTSSIE